MHCRKAAGRGFRRAGVTKGRSMSTFDDPFDSDRELSVPAASAASIAPRPNTNMPRWCCAASRSQSEQKRYEGVVASAVVRAMFPRMPRAAPS